MIHSLAPRHVSLAYLRQITVMHQSTDIGLQLNIIVLLGLHRHLTVLEIAQYLFANRPVAELPLATVELALRDLRKTALVRRHWLLGSKRWCLARYGRQLHQEMVEANSAGKPALRRSQSDGLLP